MIEIEPTLIFRALSLLVVLIIVVFSLIAYYRTRRGQILVLLLLATLVGVDILLTIGDETLENGIPSFNLLTSIFTFGISLLLLATIIRRFS